MIERKQYLDRLKQLRDKHIIKVITGVRRCGKSVLLNQFREYLLSDGVDERQIYFVNFEERKNVDLIDWKVLHDDIERGLVKDKMNYIFLDEIQNVKDWEKMVDSLFVKDNVDLYITGSNAYFLSSDLSTILAGREIAIRMLPFSFTEYCQFLAEKTDKTKEQLFFQFLRFGGMPQTAEMFLEDEALGVEYLRGVYNTVVVKDMMTRGEISDAEILERVLSYACDNVGNTFSANKVSEYLSANFRAVSSRTVERILDVAAESLVLYRTERFDVRGKELLKTQQKYYLVDSGFRNVVLGRDNEFDVGRMLENAVYLELCRRGYQVWVGKTGSGKEVDFVAKAPSGEIEYYQVAVTMRGDETRERELTALRSIDDDYKKMIICLDVEDNNYSGIMQVNAIKWFVAEPEVKLR